MPDRPTDRAAAPGAPEEQRAVTVAAALTAVVGVGLLGYAAFLVVQWLGEEPDEPVNAVLIVAFSAGWGAALLGCARGLSRRRRWARAPVVTSTLLLVTVGWLLASGHGTEVVFGWLVLVLVAACLVSVLRPTLGRALR